MSEHPTLERIVEWALGRSGSPGDLESHLETCEACRDSRAWAEALVAAVADGPPAAAPEELVRRALAIPSAHPRPATRAGWSIARLVERAFGRPQLAGVRGSPTGRRFLYAIDGGHVDLEIAPDPEDAETFRITAQVLLDEIGAPGDLLAVLWGVGTEVSSATGDASGTFAFHAVAPGAYRMELFSPSAELGIRIGEVAVGTGGP